MNNHDNNHTWVERFVRLALKRLDGVGLSESERNFMAGCEKMADLMPGALEDMILDYGLAGGGENAEDGRQEVRDELADKFAGIEYGGFDKYGLADGYYEGCDGGLYEEYRVAASSAKDLAETFEEALVKGQKFVTVQIGSEEIDAFEIQSDGIVKPLHLEGMTFRIERSDDDVQEVDPYGGVYLNLKDLKRFKLGIDMDNKLVRLYRK